MKKISLLLLLIAVVAVGVVFGQSLAMEARSRGYSDGISDRPQRSPYNSSELTFEYNTGYFDGMTARRNNNSSTTQNTQNFNNPLSIQGNNWSLEGRVERDTIRDATPDGRMMETTDTRVMGELRVTF